MRSLPVLAVLLLACAGESWAQLRVLPVEPGTRVRVVTPLQVPRKITGEVAALLRDTLVLARGGGERVAIPYLRIDTVEVSRGRDRRRGTWRGALLGSLVGAGVGVISGALGSQKLATGIETSAAIGLLGGGLLGGGLGAGAGALFPPERWQSYPLLHSPPPPAARRR